MTVTDQMGRLLEIPALPERIISIVPSQTELLFDLGVGDKVVGRTKFCIHPKDLVKKVPVVGGTKKINIDKVAALSPDLIIANKEENTRENIQELEKICPVWISDIVTLQDAGDMVLAVAGIAGVVEKGSQLLDNLNKLFGSFKPHARLLNKSVAYVIWRDPIMVAGRHTFIDSMITLFGLKNVFASWERYPEISVEEMKRLSPDYIFLSSEPFPFREKHVKEFSDICPSANVVVVDGELFSWYGSRLLKSAAYFNQLSEQLTG